MIVARFATSLRAASLAEELANAGIPASISQPRWTNKRLPPPKFEVEVAAADADRANAVLADFNAEKNQ